MSHAEFLPPDSEQPMRGPIANRIQELREVVDYAFTRAQPILDFVAAVQEHGFVLEVFGKEILRLKVGKPKGTRV